MKLIILDRGHVKYTLKNLKVIIEIFNDDEE